MISKARSESIIQNIMLSEIVCKTPHGSERASESLMSTVVIEPFDNCVEHNVEAGCAAQRVHADPSTYVVGAVCAAYVAAIS
jgi:hypothetical protein